MREPGRAYGQMGHGGEEGARSHGGADRPRRRPGLKGAAHTHQIATPSTGSLTDRGSTGLHSGTQSFSEQDLETGALSGLDRGTELLSVLSLSTAFSFVAGIVAGSCTWSDDQRGSGSVVILSSVALLGDGLSVVTGLGSGSPSTLGSGLCSAQRGRWWAGHWVWLCSGSEVDTLQTPDDCFPPTQSSGLGGRRGNGNLPRSRTGSWLNSTAYSNRERS